MDYADIYLLIGAVLASAIGWGAVKLGGYLSAKTKNETFSGLITRVAHSISDAVAMAEQVTRREILEAKDPNSPGGVEVTKGEEEQIKDAVWLALKEEYGSLGKLFGLFSGIGMNEKAAKSKVDTMIESEVHKKKLRSKP